MIEAARLSGHGAREFWWYVREPEPMDVLLTEFAAQPVLFRTFDYEIKLDADRDVLDRFEPWKRGEAACPRLIPPSFAGTVGLSHNRSPSCAVRSSISKAF